MSSLLRLLRIKLRNGWMKEAPPEYFQLLRNPPSTPDSRPCKPVPESVPYLKYLKEAQARNPKYGAESVFGAYWQDEPLALILARRQYELVKGGMDEESAYLEAEKYAEKFEQDAYEELVNVKNLTLEKGARMPFAADKEIATEIARWKRILSRVRYDKLSDADMGEIDYLLQTKVLKWNEVERNRRMVDPIFVVQFEQLREAIFPEINAPRHHDFTNSREQYKAEQLALFGVPSVAHLYTAAPFYYEDYVHFFNRLKDQPYLAKWSERNREKLSRWIIDSMAMKAKMENKTRHEMQAYLDSIRAQFFPMIRQPHLANEYNLPSSEQIRSMLYNNDIGYKTEDGKLFVFRSYRIPMLLFPKETLTAIFSSDHEKLENALSDNKVILREMERAGLDRSKLEEIKQELQSYYDNEVVPQDNKGPSVDEGIDMSIIDDLLNDDASFNSTEENPKVTAPPQNFDVEELVGKGDNLDEVLTASEAERKSKGVPLPAEFADIDWRVMEDGADPEDRIIRSEEERQRLLRKHKLVADSALERARLEVHEEAEEIDWKHVRTEFDMSVIAAQRLERETIMRARSSRAYGIKEGARRMREYERRRMINANILAEPEIRPNGLPKRATKYG